MTEMARSRHAESGAGHVHLSIDCAFWLSMPMPATYKLSFDGSHLRSALGLGLKSHDRVHPNDQSR